MGYPTRGIKKTAPTRIHLANFEGSGVRTRCGKFLTGIGSYLIDEDGNRDLTTCVPCLKKAGLPLKQWKDGKWVLT